MLAPMSSTPGRQWTSLTRAYVGLLATCVALYALTKAVAVSPWLAKALAVTEGALLQAAGVVGLVWLHRAWTRVPPSHRRAYDGRRIEPDEAIWKLFVPLYGIYWLFLANIGLCGAIERHLHRGGARSAKAPSTTAFIACFAQMVPVVNLLVSPFLWAVFMARVDAAQAQAEARDPEPRAPAPPGILKTLAIIVGGLVAEWVLLLAMFLAIWQALNPAGVPGAPR